MGVNEARASNHHVEKLSRGIKTIVSKIMAAVSSNDDIVFLILPISHSFALICVFVTDSLQILIQSMFSVTQFFAN